MKHCERRLTVSAAALIATGVVMSPRAFASGVEVAGAVAVCIAILLKVWPVIVAWLVGVRTLFGRPSGLKFGFGIVHR